MVRIQTSNWSEPTMTSKHGAKRSSGSQLIFEWFLFVYFVFFFVVGVEKYYHPYPIAL